MPKLLLQLTFNGVCFAANSHVDHTNIAKSSDTSWTEGSRKEKYINDEKNSAFWCTSNFHANYCHPGPSGSLDSAPVVYTCLSGLITST